MKEAVASSILGGSLSLSSLSLASLSVPSDEASSLSEGSFSSSSVFFGPAGASSMEIIFYNFDVI
jgi:hypothetical protein